MSEFEVSEHIVSNDLEINIIDKVKQEIENKQDKTYRRFFLTWNNPFWENQFEEVDIEKTDIKLNLDKYDLHYFKKDENIHLFEFKYIKYKNSKSNLDEVVERPFFKDKESIGKYIEILTNFKYTAFQIERGGNSELTHIQAMIIFSKPFHWTTFARCFPVADFDPIYGSNSKARAYCTKEETRISEPVEIGQFAEERERTDVKEFLEMLNIGADDEVLEKNFPNLYLREFNKLDNLRLKKLFNKYSKIRRNVKVTYIYGNSGVGKTTYISDLLGFEDTFFVDQYDLSAFTNYKGEKNIVFDEYKGRFPVDFMNKLLDKNPVQLRGLNVVKYACFENVYIISNYSPKELPFYQDLFNQDSIAYKSFERRLHNIVHWLGFSKWKVEKGEFVAKQLEFEEIELSEDEENLRF